MSSPGRRRYRSIYLSLALFVLFAAGTLQKMSAQAVNATLTGHVTDVQGAMVPNATLTVRNTATGAVRTAQSDTEGRYLVTPLQPGPYQVKVEVAGFTTKTLTGITLNVGDTQQLEVSLTLGGVSDTVSVEAVSYTHLRAHETRHDLVCR